MDNYRMVLEIYKKKLENASRGTSKELRLNKTEIIELHQALISLLLVNAELRLTNDELKKLIQPNQETPSLDGGSF